MKRPARPTHSTVAAYLALTIALTGSAYAAATVKSSDIVDGQVKSVDVRDDSLKGGGLTGDDIREGTLGTVRNARKVNNLRASKVAKPGKLLALDADGRLAAGPSDISVLEDTPCTREGKEGRLDTFHPPLASPNPGASSRSDLVMNCLVKDNLEPNDTQESNSDVAQGTREIQGVSIFPAGDVDDFDWIDYADEWMGMGWVQTVALMVPSGAELEMDVFHEGSLVAEDVTCYATGATAQEAYRVVVDGVGDEVAEYSVRFTPWGSC